MTFLNMKLASKAEQSLYASPILHNPMIPFLSRKA
jgi:hypothetical protein